MTDGALARARPQLIEAKGKAGGIRRARWAWRTREFVREADELMYMI